VKKVIVIAAIAVVLSAVASTAMAAGISYPFPGGPYQAKYLDYEEFLTAAGAQDTTVSVGDTNQGYAVLQQIAPLLAPNTPGPNTYAWLGVGGGGSQVTTVFSGITVTTILDITLGNVSVASITPGFGGQGLNDSYDIQSTGGTLSLYSNISNVFDPSNPATATSGTLEAQFTFIGGVLPASPLVTVDGVTTKTSPLTGKATSYADVILNGLPWATSLDGNAIPFQSFPAGADAFLTSDFQALDPAYVTLNYTFTSNDPVIGTALVPEPGTLSLMGIGFIGLAGLGGRRFFRQR